MSSVQNGDEQASDGRNKITFKPLKKEHNNPNNYCLLLRGPNSPPPPPFSLEQKDIKYLQTKNKLKPNKSY